MNENVAALFMKIYDADAIMNEPTSKINKVIRISKPSLKMIFGEAFDKNSIVFISALRFCVVTIIAAIIAYQFNLERSYWVPLSCVAVMSGSTIVATYHRAIQRGIGTIVGILIASFILAYTAIWIHHCSFYSTIDVYYRAFYCEKLRVSCTVLHTECVTYG